VAWGPNNAPSCFEPLSAERPTVVLIGPGGVGKGTIAQRIVQQEPRTWLSRSWTTRAQRPSELGDEYVFVDRDTFERAIEDDRFLEWAEFHGNLYGTPRPEPGDERILLLEIEVQGAEQVVRADHDAVVILIEPPSMEELRERLEGRGDTPEHVATRLGSTAHELAIGRELAHYRVVNHEIDAAVDEILSILRGLR